MEISKDFGTLVIRFRLLKYLRTDPIKSVLELHYPKEAFEGREPPAAIVPESISGDRPS